MSIAAWHLGRGADAMATAEAAIAILEPLGPGPELARAYVNLAGQRMLATAGQDRATGLARRAERLAERLGLPDVLSDALNTQACMARRARAGAWPASSGGPWTWRWRRARKPRPDGPTSTCTAASAGNGSSPRASRTTPRASAYCDDHDIPTFSIFLRSEWASSAGEDRPVGRGPGHRG